NVVIYFDEPTRERLWGRLADKLESGGFLYVGHSEKVANPRQCGLEQVAPTIYRKAS
ncbi:chemotaxis protein, partial [Acetobacter fabarum]